MIRVTYFQVLRTSLVRRWWATTQFHRFTASPPSRSELPRVNNEETGFR